MFNKHNYLVDKQATVDLKREILQKEINLEEKLDQEMTTYEFAHYEKGVIQGMIIATQKLKLFDVAEESIVVEKLVKLTQEIKKLKYKENASQGRPSK